ncbi:MAG: histidine phosphatase family protein [Actinomycetota bacterium]|nr:histidine phosphatase family protein [Actinomycetota bacterium]
MLWLLRHADAADGHPDEARPLTPRGFEQARLAGLALAQLGVKPQLCLSSPKRRAAETARTACAPLGVEVRLDAALAACAYDPEQLAAGLHDVILVGHNPAISAAVQALTGARVRLRKGGIAAVDRGELALLLTPRELAAVAAGTGPAADAEDSQRRARR